MLAMALKTWNIDENMNHIQCHCLTEILVVFQKFRFLKRKKNNRAIKIRSILESP